MTSDEFSKPEKLQRGFQMYVYHHNCISQSNLRQFRSLFFNEKISYYLQ